MKKINTKILAMIGIILVAFFMIGCSKVEDHKEEVTKIRIGNLPVVHGVPLYLAIEKGYFKDAGIEVEVVKFESPNQIIDALMQDKIDFGSTSTALGITGVADFKNPNKIKIFAAAGSTKDNPNENILVPLDSSISSIKELKGKKLGILGGSIQWRTITKSMLAQNGLEMDKDVIIVELSTSLQAQALASKQIDALLALEPISTIIQEKKIGKVAVRAPVEEMIADPFYPGAGVVRVKFAQENPETTAKVIQVFNKAIKEVNENPDAAKKYLKDYTPLPEELIPKVPLPNFKMCDELLDADIEGIQKFYDIFHDYGVVDGKIDPESLLYCK